MPTERLTRTRAGNLKLTTTDVGIMRCLSRDARSPISKIAASLKVPESTVRHRLKRLVQSKLLSFAAVTNPLELGYQIWAVIEIQTDIPHVRAVAKELAELPEVHFVGITAGSYDVLVTAVFRSNAELLDFVTHRLSRIKGIGRTSTSTVLELVKRSVTFTVPDHVLEARAASALDRKRRERHRRSARVRGG